MKIKALVTQKMTTTDGAPGEAGTQSRTGEVEITSRHESTFLVASAESFDDSDIGINGNRVGKTSQHYFTCNQLNLIEKRVRLGRYGRTEGNIKYLITPA